MKKYKHVNNKAQMPVAPFNTEASGSEIPHVAAVMKYTYGFIRQNSRAHKGSPTNWEGFQGTSVYVQIYIYESYPDSCEIVYTQVAPRPWRMREHDCHSNE